MNLREKRKFVAEYAKKANEILQETRANNPEFLGNRWQANLTNKNFATKKGTFRQSAPYKMNTEQLKKYMATLGEFVRDIERQQRKKEEYQNEGFPSAYDFVNRLGAEYWNYYYGDYDEYEDTTKTVLQNMAMVGDISEQEAFAIIERAFRDNGRPDLPPQQRPKIGATSYTSQISRGGKYL